MRQPLPFAAATWSFAAVALLAAAATSRAQAAPPIGPRFVVLDEANATLLGFRDDTLAPTAVGGPATCRLRSSFLVARSGADLLDATLPQAHDDLGATAIELPDGGWLAQWVDHAAQRSGVLWIGPVGQCVTLLDLPFVNGRNALRREIAVSPHEARAAVLEEPTVTGRGDVWLLRYDGPSFAATGSSAFRVTATQKNADAEPQSLTFADRALFFADDVFLFRAPTDGSASAQSLTLPSSGGQPPVELGKEIAVSRDGSTIVFLAGASESSWDLHVGDAAGNLRNLTNAPAAYNSVGYLAEMATGPQMALTDDGATLVYCADVPDLEFFSVPTDGSALPTPFTTDAEFEHSLADGSTVIALASGPRFSFGEGAANRDLYRVQVGGGAPAITNLTGTSGSTAAPFLKGATLQPRVAARTSGDGLLLVDRIVTAGQPTTYDVWTVDAGGGATTLSGLAAAPVLIRGGAPLAPVTLAVITTATGSSLWQLSDTVSGGATRIVDAPGLALRGVTLRADGAEAAFIASAGVGIEQVFAVALATGRLRVLTPTAGFASSGTGYSPSGRVLFGFSPVAATHLAAYAEAPAGSGLVRRLRGGRQPRFLTPR